MSVYTVVAVSRTPAQSAGPNLLELGPLLGAFTYTNNLYEPGKATVTSTVDGLISDIKTKLIDLSATPLEVWIYRDSTMVFAGPVMGGTIQDGSLTLECQDLLGYLGYMLVTTAEAWEATEQATIVKALVDDWQALDYGNFGIVTSDMGTTGTTRTQSLAGDKTPFIVLDEVLRLAKADNGFNPYVEPATRKLKTPAARGSDLSGLVILERGVKSASVRFSVAPGLIASEVYALGTDAENTPITATTSNTALRAAFGRVGYAASVDATAGDTTLLSDFAAAWKAERASQLFQPSPEGLIPVSGAGIDDFEVGDTVTYAFDAGIGWQTGDYRILKKTVTVDEAGAEDIEVEFA